MTDMVVFEVAGLRGAVPARCVHEIVRAVEIAPLPGAPATVEGIINVRGEIVPVVSLRARFGLPASPVQPSEQIILISTASNEIAFRVDSALNITPVPDDDVSSPDALAQAGWNVSGVARTPDGLLVIHDPDAFVSEVEHAAVAEALSRRQVDDQTGIGSFEGAARC